METELLTSVAFTGHRSCPPDVQAILDPTLRRLAKSGYSTFLTGMAEGFDLYAGEAVLRLREEGLPIRLVCVIPYADQPKRLPPHAAKSYQHLLERADQVILLQQGYTPGCFHRRNDFLVDHAVHIVAWYNGTKVGGTYYTIRQARRKAIPVENIHPNERHNLFDSLK